MNCFKPDKFYKEMSTISPTCNLYLHMNIFSKTTGQTGLSYQILTWKVIPTHGHLHRTLIHTDNKLIYKIWNDLKPYKEKKTESTFLGIEPNLRNKTVGYTYKHPNVAVT